MVAQARLCSLPSLFAFPKALEFSPFQSMASSSVNRWLRPEVRSDLPCDFDFALFDSGSDYFPPL